VANHIQQVAKIVHVFGEIFFSNLVPPALLLCIIVGVSFINPVYGHFSHLPHYNGGGLGIGRYYVYQAMDPEYTPTNQPAQISFSIQDYNGNDVTTRMMTMVEIYSERTGERIATYPWTMRPFGDFYLYHTFKEVGNYQIVLSISDSSNKIPPQIGTGSPPRGILINNEDCKCDRGVFNISVTNSFGDIFVTAVFVGIFGIIIVFGVVLLMTYRNQKRNEEAHRKTENKFVLKYAIMLLAMAAGFVHLAVYADHGSLRIEYSIFLLVAGACQFAYGMLYTLLTISNRQMNFSNMQFALTYYKKTLILNLFGLIGTGVLLGLYIYSVVLPPPLSPNKVPENIDLGGVMDKILEASLVLGIIYLMGWEKRQLRANLLHTA
jgi:hypothetical protein